MKDGIHGSRIFQEENHASHFVAVTLYVNSVFFDWQLLLWRRERIGPSWPW